MMDLRKLLLAVSVFLAGCIPRPYTIPAHWTGSTDRVEPVVEDFEFDEIDFATPNEGWIVGYRFLLHIRGNELTRTFIDPGEAWLRTVEVLSTDTGWAGGFRLLDSGRSEPVIWRYRRGEWSPIELDLPGLEGCSVRAIRFASPRQGWALGLCDPDRTDGKAMVLRYDGKLWSVDSFPDGGGGNWTLIDLCVDDSGNGWAVGKQRNGGNPAKPLIVKIDGGVWRIADADVSVHEGGFNRVSCFPDGKALASGIDGTIFEGEPILFAYDGSWKRIEVPERLRGMSIVTLAGPSADDFWLSLFEPAGTALLAHFTDGNWVEMPGPVVPHGGLQGYMIRDICFVSEDEAWAVAHDVHGPGLFRGLVFHYKDGAWRNRNWNWHFWDERWFGLLGR